MANKTYLISFFLLAQGLFLMALMFPHDLEGADVDYVFFDRIGELKLISVNKDLYTEKVDSSERRRITASPETIERDAFFSADGRYVLYLADESRRFAAGVVDIKYAYFIQPIDADDGLRVKIDPFVYRDFKKERVLEKGPSSVFVNTDFGQSAEKTVEEITEPQPLAIGMRIFTKSAPQAGYQAYYTYMSFEDNVLKIKYEMYYHRDELEETDIFTLPLGANKQALLATKPLFGETATTAAKLSITVVDDVGRVKVQKYK